MISTSRLTGWAMSCACCQRRCSSPGTRWGRIYSAIRASRYYEGSGLEVRIIDDFKQAVKSRGGSGKGRRYCAVFPGPAQPFDRFKNFAERGRYFKSIVMELK